MLSRILSRLRWLRLRIAGAEIAYGVEIPKDLLIGQPSGLECAHHGLFSTGARVLIGSFRGKPGKLKIGPYFFLNHFSIIDCHHSITIGQSVMIGPHCYIGDFDHDLSVRDEGGWSQEITALPIRIENDAWVGAGVIILKGVTIGQGAVVGAGSVITKDVRPYAVVAGNPARELRSRNSEQTKRGSK